VSVPVTVTLEVQFVPGGSYVDLTALGLVRSISIIRPRPTIDSPVQPTTLTAVLENAPDKTTGIAPLTPDSPLGTWYPNVDRDRLVRVTAVWAGGASTSVRFLGWSDTWTPDAGDGSLGASMVTLTASCVISRYARRRLISDYGEYITTPTYQSDYWPYDDAPDAASLRGLSGDITVPAAQVIQPVTGTGAMSLGKVDATILVDGAASFSRGDSNGASPVILHTLRGTQLQRVAAWIKLDQDPAAGQDDVMTAYDVNGVIVWRLSAGLVSGKIEWQVIDVNNVKRTFYGTNQPRDDSWHWISVGFFDNAGDPGTDLAIRDKSIPDRFVAGYIPTWPSDPSLGCAYLVVGGRMSPKTIGKQNNTVMGSVSSLWVNYQTSGNFSWSNLSAAGQVFTGFDRAGNLNKYGAYIDAPVGTGLGHTNADLTPVQLTGTNLTLLDAWAEHARTTQGRILTRPDGRRQWNTPANVKPAAVSLTLDAETDLHMPAGGWQGERIERPTRVTGTSPAGSITVIDTTTEALTGLRLDGPDLATAGGSISVPQSAASAVLTAGTTRMSSFGVDATLTQTDKVATLMGLLPGQRVRVSGLPSGTLGVSYLDVYASGWVESAVGAQGSYQFVFDTDPADDPSEAIFDDAEYGRHAFGDGVATATGGTCVGNTGTGTAIITSTSPLTTTGAQYPMDLDWNGERITISGVGGGTSPQTATVTVRGVAPSIARSHASGETVEIWHAARFGA
jgi:hypothetical protein